MSQWITPKVSIPQRNISNEMDTIYRKTAQYADPYAELEERVGPRYNRLNVRNLGDQILGFDDGSGHVPGTLELSRAASEFQREGDLLDVERMGGRINEASLDANPMLRRALETLGTRGEDSELLRMLNETAKGGLASGGALTDQEKRDADEDSLAAFAERGILNGNQSMLGQFMNREAMKRARMAGAVQQATQVEDLNQKQSDFVGRSAQIFRTALPDAWMALLNRASGGAGGGVSMTPIGAGTKNFDPFNPYFQDYFSSNQNAKATEAVANAQAQAATRAAIASMASGFISDIRAKEKIVEIADCRLQIADCEIPIVEFEYRAGCVPKGLRPVRYRGVIAQDVEEVLPAAVSVDPETGFKRVNYAMLGLEMAEISETGNRISERRAA